MVPLAVLAGDDQVQRTALSLDAATNAVLAANPALKAAEKKWEAMKARVPQAAAW